MVSAAIIRVAGMDGLDQDFILRLLDYASHLEAHINGLGFCLSEEPDQLGQWRGYGDDAAGISIGFSKAYLESLGKQLRENEQRAFNLGKVEYEPDVHDAQVRPAYRKMRELIDDGVFDLVGGRSLLDTRSDQELEEHKNRVAELNASLSLTMLSLFQKLYLLKSPAFAEEREWRLISYHSNRTDDDMRFRAASDRIVPFRSFEMLDLKDIPVVKHVILGPKHITPVTVIDSFLAQSGFEDVAVERSAASYR